MGTAAIENERYICPKMYVDRPGKDVDSVRHGDGINLERLMLCSGYSSVNQFQQQRDDCSSLRGVLLTLAATAVRFILP